MDLDQVSAVIVAGVFFVCSCNLLYSLSMSCLVHHFVLIRHCKCLLVVAQLSQEVAQLSHRDGVRMPKVRLDVFHARQRISRLVKKNHGAFNPFMARLRDSFIILYSDDIKEASLLMSLLALVR